MGLPLRRAFFLVIYFCAFHAADHDLSVTLSAAEKQNLLLEYMFNKNFVPDLIPYVKPYNIYCRIEAMQKLRGLYQPGHPAYALAKATCRNIYHLIQQPSLDDKESMIRLFVRYNIEPVIHNKLFAVQRSFASGPDQEQMKMNFTQGITALFNAFYLQQALGIPCLEDQEFDGLYQKKMEQALKHLYKAASSEVPFEIEEPQRIKDLLSKNTIDPAEINEFVAIAFDETRKIAKSYANQKDPHCGI